ncbi:MAG: prephenate dehydrogenase [Bryobacteraceae bacterium]
MRPWSTVTIAGVGLIGGSFALALRSAGFTGKIIGVSSLNTIAAAVERGVIDVGLPLAEAAAQSDVVYLAQPIERIITMLDEVDSVVRPGTLITDAGSTKLEIVERAAKAVQRGRFVGGHPMAGKEARGVEAADPHLFRGRPYVLTSPDPLLEEWVGRIGARLVRLDAAEHDRLAAVVSHVPQLISTALAATIGMEPDARLVAGPASHDLTRLALSPYDIWRDIFATNTGEIDAALGRFIAKLEQLRAALRSGPAADFSNLKDEFERAGDAARAIRRTS